MRKEIGFVTVYDDITENEIGLQFDPYDIKWNQAGEHKMYLGGYEVTGAVLEISLLKQGKKYLLKNLIQDGEMSCSFLYYEGQTEENYKKADELAEFINNWKVIG